MEPIVFVDLETTGLDPSRHEIWEAAFVHNGEGSGYAYRMEPILGNADEGALRVSRFYDVVGRDEFTDAGFWTDPAEAAWAFTHHTAGKHLAGMNPAFDAAFLRAFLRRHGLTPAWHYHLIDVEALALGYLYGATAANGHGYLYGATAANGHEPIDMPGVPWSSDALSRAVGVAPPLSRHSAHSDALWAQAIYEKVTDHG